ncbi:MAG: NUDIX domain-containing protein [Hyphomicrobiales bacterium]
MRMRACGLVHRGGKVLLQRKIHDVIWALPGGRVEAGETPEFALVREFREELGWEVAVGRRLWTIENAFSHDGRMIRQTEVCFEVTCDGPLSVIDKTLDFRWVEPAEALTIDVRPEAIRHRLFGS